MTSIGGKSSFAPMLSRPVSELRLSPSPESVEGTFTTVGGGVQQKVNTAAVAVTLVDKDLRAFHQLDAMAHTRALLAAESNVIVAVGQLNASGSSGGNTSPVQLELRGGDLQDLSAVAERIAVRLTACRR